MYEALCEALYMAMSEALDEALCEAKVHNAVICDDDQTEDTKGTPKL